MPQRIQSRRGTASAWTTANPVLAAGEIGVESDTHKMKAGDGSTAWASLPYLALDRMTYVADGDSRTAGVGGPSWFDLLCGDPEGAVVGKNYGIGGKTVAQILSGYAATGAASSSVSGEHQWSPAVTGNRGVYFLWGSTNDLSTGASAASVLANLQALYAHARNDGYSRIVGFIETPRPLAPGAGWETAYEAQRIALEASMRALTLGQSNTPDILIDTAGLFPNPSSYFDFIHISPAQQRILAQYVRETLAGEATSFRHSCTLTINFEQHYVNGAVTLINSYGSVVSDPQGLYDGVNYGIRCPIAGWVRVEVGIFRSVAAAGDVWNMQIWSTPSGGSAAFKQRLMWVTDVSGSSLDLRYSAATMQVAAGELLDFRIEGNSGNNTWYMASGSSNTQFVLRYLPPPF